MLNCMPIKKLSIHLRFSINNISQTCLCWQFIEVIINNRFNHNCSLFTMPRKIASVFPVASHTHRLCSHMRFSECPSLMNCKWCDALLNEESKWTLYEEFMNRFLKVCDSLSSYFVKEWILDLYFCQRKKRLLHHE